MSFPLINPAITFLDSSGSPLVGGTIEFRDPTTNAFIDSYPTADDADAQTNANDNPLALNFRGEAPNGLYLEDDTAHRVILKDANGSTVWTQDDVRSPGRASTLTYSGPGTVSRSIDARLNDRASIDDFATMAEALTWAEANNGMTSTVATVSPTTSKMARMASLRRN